MKSACRCGKIVAVRKFLRKTLLWLLAAVLVVLAVVLAALPLAVPWTVAREAEKLAAAQGFPIKVRMRLGYCWRNGPGIAGKAAVYALDAPWRVEAEFGASCCEWAAAVKMDKTEFSERDAVVRRVLERFPIPEMTNLVFSGTVSLEARAERTFRKPVPVWSVRVPLKNLSASCSMAEKSVAAKGFSVTLAANGIAEHMDVVPMHVRGKSLVFDGFELTDVRAAIQASEDHLLMTEATAGFCGGKVGVYALNLAMKNLNTGFTLFVDNVDAGKALSHLNGFRGTADGRLHGKVKLFAREGGKSIRLSDAFLYSTPGEVGKLRLPDNETVADYLTMTGMDADECRNLANVMTDVDYSVLKLDLKRGEGRSATLSVRVAGSATRGSLTVPVDVTLNFKAEIEQLLNLGLDYTNKLKGMK